MYVAAETRRARPSERTIHRRLSVERGWVAVLLQRNLLLVAVLHRHLLLLAVLRQRHLLLLAADAELLSPTRAARRYAECFGAVMAMADLRAFVRAALRDRGVGVAAAAADRAEHRA